MNVTKLSGWVLLIFAVIYAVITIISFSPKYAAASHIGEKASDYGLQTTGTNLRFQMGSELLVDVLCIGLLAIAGWWLTTQEVVQIAWAVIVGLVLVVSVVVRTTPIVPLNVLTLSPGAAFYGAQFEAVVTGDPATKYVVITREEAGKMRPALVSTATGQKVGEVVLDLRNPTGYQKFMSCATYPVTISGTVAGTSGIAAGRSSRTVALLHVRDAYMGMPQKK